VQTPSGYVSKKVRSSFSILLHSRKVTSAIIFVLRKQNPSLSKIVYLSGGSKIIFLFKGIVYAGEDLPERKGIGLT
jgi:hypothetical protein